MRCSNEDCDDKLLLDGEEIGVINMKSYLIAHEVLRDYMYQFLYARFVRQAVFLMQCTKVNIIGTGKSFVLYTGV